MRKLTLLFALVLLSSCVNITAPFASTANVVFIYKTQVGETGDMYGSDLKEVAKGNKQEAGDIKAPPPGG